MNVKASFSLTHRTVSLLGLAINSLTRPRGAKAVSLAISNKTQEGALTLSISREGLVFVEGKDIVNIDRSAAYSNRLREAGFSEITLPQNSTPEEIKSFLDTMGDSRLSTVLAHASIDVQEIGLAVVDNANDYDVLASLNLLRDIMHYEYRSREHFLVNLSPSNKIALIKLIKTANDNFFIHFRSPKAPFVHDIRRVFASFLAEEASIALEERISLIGLVDGSTYAQLLSDFLSSEHKTNELFAFVFNHLSFPCHPFERSVSLKLAECLIAKPYQIAKILLTFLPYSIGEIGHVEYDDSSGVDCEAKYYWIVDKHAEHNEDDYKLAAQIINSHPIEKRLQILKELEELISGMLDHCIGKKQNLDLADKIRPFIEI